MSLERASAADSESLDLARRSGWPEDLRVLVSRYPREQWAGHANLGEMARFWLSRHAMFRELTAMIRQIETEFRAGRLPPQEFASAFVPRLQFLLSQLEVHHQIEDYHYFPIFRAADARLARGFDVLEGDHHAIHADMARRGRNRQCAAAGAGRRRRHVCARAATIMRRRAARCSRACCVILMTRRT